MTTTAAPATAETAADDRYWPDSGQLMSFLAAWLGWVMDAFDFTIYLLVMPMIGKEFNVSTTTTTLALTMTLLVRLLGGVAAGAAADRWGRKLPLMLSVIWFAVFDGAIAFAGSFGTVLVLRTLFGFGMGAEWTAGATLAMENWPARSRGIASGILQGSWAIGYFLAALVSGWVLPLWGWRALFLIAAAPALLAFFIRFWVPESREFKKVQQAAAKAPLFDLSAFKGQWGGLALSVLLMGLGFSVYYGVSGLYPTLLIATHGFGPVQVAHHVELFNLGMLVSAVVCGLAASRWGPRVAIGVPALLMVVTMPLYVGLGFQPDVLWVGALLGGAFGAGFCGVTPLLLTGFFPAHVRARSVGFAYHAGAAMAAFVPLGTAALSEHYKVPMTWAIGSVAGVACVLLAIALFIPVKQLQAPSRAPAPPGSTPAPAQAA